MLASFPHESATLVCVASKVWHRPSKALFYSHQQRVPPPEGRVRGDDASHDDNSSSINLACREVGEPPVL